MGKKLYVGNLTYNVNESDLEALFAPFGSVQSAQIIVDRDTNRSKGFGFVEMGSDAEAQAAIQGLNGHDHDGRNLTVNEAKPREERGGGGGRGGYGGGGGGRGGYGGVWWRQRICPVEAVAAVGVIEHSIMSQRSKPFQRGFLTEFRINPRPTAITGRSFETLKTERPQRSAARPRRSSRFR